MQAHPGRALSSDDVLLGVLPLFHIFGLNVVLGGAFHAGASVVLIERFDPISALEAVQRHGVTVVLGAPTMWSAWAAVTGHDDLLRTRPRGALRDPHDHRNTGDVGQGLVRQPGRCEPCRDQHVEGHFAVVVASWLPLSSGRASCSSITGMPSRIG